MNLDLFQLNPITHYVLSAILLVVVAVDLPAAPKALDYANDLGPDTIDVSSYPPDMREIYPLFQKKCGTCHTAARAINSEFIEAKQWSRYILRMQMRPPCCNRCPYISHDDAKAIWNFLVYDSQIRKTGSQAEAWSRHRTALLAELKTKYPGKYVQRYGKSDNAQKEKL